MTGTEIVIKSTGEVATEESINGYLMAIIERLPDPESGDMTGILSQIINAAEFTDLDSPWQSAGMDKFRDHAITIRSIKKMESDVAGGLGWYLLCEGTVLETGEYQAFSTSSVSIMAQLLVAHDRGMFPLTVYIRRATKASKNGFYPMHLEIYRQGAYYDPQESAAPSAGRRIPASAGTPRAERTARAAEQAAGMNQAAAGPAGTR